MAAFGKKKREHTALWELALPVLFFLALVALLWWGLGNISRTTEAEQLKSAEQAVRRATVQCYALEGRYPENLDYLEENYGLVIDHDRYLVHYQSIGANMMPQITVFPVGGEPG